MDHFIYTNTQRTGRKYLEIDRRMKPEDLLYRKLIDIK